MSAYVFYNFVFFKNKNFKKRFREISKNVFVKTLTKPSNSFVFQVWNVQNNKKCTTRNFPRHPVRSPRWRPWSLCVRWLVRMNELASNLFFSSEIKLFFASNPRSKLEKRNKTTLENLKTVQKQNAYRRHRKLNPRDPRCRLLWRPNDDYKIIYVVKNLKTSENPLVDVRKYVLIRSKFQTCNLFLKF